jgi:hypothetical protein
MASDGLTDVFDTDTAKKSSDLSATAAEFPPVQIKGLQRPRYGESRRRFVGSRANLICSATVQRWEIGWVTRLALCTATRTRGYPHRTD